MEQIILRALMSDETLTRQILPYLKAEYFSNPIERIIYKNIEKFINTYNTLPTSEALIVELGSSTKINESEYKGCIAYVEELSTLKAEQERRWILDKTEKFCQEKALYNAIMESISIIDGGNQEKDKGSIPSILSEALAISFDPNVGHDFISDADKRYEFYHKEEQKIPFDIDILNKITNGGLPNKSLNLITAATGGGKSLFKCHMAASNLMLGKNVLYITMEMAEERIAERIDANLLNCTLDELKTLSKSQYEKKVSVLRGRTTGKLIIKEYPTASAHVGHFRHLLNELRLKKGFVPDIIYIDYLNICASSRMRLGGSINSYSYIKAIAEEIRGLAVERNVPIVTSTQVNRTGVQSSDVEMTDVSDSFGTVATVDWLVSLIGSEELDKLGQVMIKQLKNRYGDLNYYKRFVVGIDRARMRLYNIEDSGQNKIADSGTKVKETGHKKIKSDDFKFD